MTKHDNNSKNTQVLDPPAKNSRSNNSKDGIHTYLVCLLACLSFYQFNLMFPTITRSNLTRPNLYKIHLQSTT
ncbi:hypothetical protein EYC80_007731 [Monilinia laxa]|uniref:Uncharacterized protein n=1 Tax=Monilinia laxa TaxID=61186 RepID=A0A5N6JWV0_MONLA|nr:hypothetical protein EYC80_007731 [Monilinia laxa]